MSDYEKSIIDSCLSDKKNLYRVIGELYPDDFTSALCQKAFVTIASLVKKGVPVTSVTLCDRDPSIPQDLFCTAGVNGDNLDYFISKLKDQGKLKRLKKTIAQCQNIIESPEVTPDEALQLTQDIILGSFANHKKDDMDTEDIGDAVLKLYEEKKKKRMYQQKREENKKVIGGIL